MKTITNYIMEKLKIGKTTKPNYVCQPKTKAELKEILRERLAKDKNANLNDIDVSEMTDMFKLFANLDPHNIDISQWDVSKVEDMEDMFFGCENLDCDLSDWDISKVINMRSMFEGCKKFNCDLSNWDVSNANIMSRMFFNCTNFEGNGLENWNVRNQLMRWIFYGCKSMKNMPSWYKN